MIWTVERGRVVHVKEYYDRAEALEAVGLREREMSQENVSSTKSRLDFI